MYEYGVIHHKNKAPANQKWSKGFSYLKGVLMMSLQINNNYHFLTSQVQPLKLFPDNQG